MEDHRHALRLIVEGREGLRDRLLGSVGIAQVDDEGLARASGDRDLRRERPALVIGVGAVPVEVEAGLPDRDHLRARGELPDRLRRRLVEAGRAVRMPAHRSEHPILFLGGPHGAGIRILPEPDGQDATNARSAGRRDQLILVGLAESEVRVGIDHGAQYRTSVMTGG